LRYFVNLQAALNALSDEVTDFRTNTAPNSLRATKTRNASSGLKDPDWQPFLLTYSGDVDGVIRVKVAEAERNASGRRGVRPTKAITAAGAFVADDADLVRQPLLYLKQRGIGFKGS
jgi:hypothetical protein